VRGLRGEEEGGGVRSGPGAARTIPLFHTISARPPKQPRMVRTFLKVHTCVCFITAGPLTKLFAWGEEESGGHVL
jgi:hypothetical protein